MFCVLEIRGGVCGDFRCWLRSRSSDIRKFEGIILSLYGDLYCS
jgi:hypothetical protein